MRLIGLALFLCVLPWSDGFAQTAFDKGVNQAAAIAVKGQRLVEDGRLKVIADCETTEIKVPYVYPVYPKSTIPPMGSGRGITLNPPEETPAEAHIVVTGWTGGCRDGKRDGKGELSIRIARDEGARRTVSENREEGEMVAGRELGLWCRRQSTFLISGKPLVGGSSGFNDTCVLKTGENMFGKGSVGRYRKLDDGRWQLWTYRGPAEPASYLAAGELEANSENMVAAGRAGGSVSANVKVSTAVLDDLIRGARITLEPGTGSISLQDKRVAVVLSTRTIEEIEKFRRERQVIIERTRDYSNHPFAPKARADFITATDPDRMLESIMKMLRGQAREVVPAESLAGMKAAGIDYAIVIDWKSFTRMDLLGKYADFPGFPKIRVDDQANALFGRSITAYMITPELRAIRQVHNRFSRPKTGGDEDKDYLFALSREFYDDWGRSAQAEGSMAHSLRVGLLGR